MREVLVVADVVLEIIQTCKEKDHYFSQIGRIFLENLAEGSRVSFVAGATLLTQNGHRVFDVVFDLFKRGCLEVHIRVSEDTLLSSFVCSVPLLELLAAEQIVHEIVIDGHKFLVVS